MKNSIIKRVFRYTCSTLLVTFGLTEAQPAKGANKFLGNITSRGQVRSDFGTYWNQITPENETKWGSVEGTRDRMNWAGADRVANYAKTAGIPWKFHTPKSPSGLMRPRRNIPTCPCSMW